MTAEEHAAIYRAQAKKEVEMVGPDWKPGSRDELHLVLHNFCRRMAERYEKAARKATKEGRG